RRRGLAPSRARLYGAGRRGPCARSRERGAPCDRHGRRQAAPARRTREDAGAGRLTMTRKQRRLVLIGSGLGVLGLAAGLVLFALRDSIVFFNSPTDVVEKRVAPGSRIRLGGLVKQGTLQRGDNLFVRFEVTDGN